MSMKYFSLPGIRRRFWVIGVFVRELRIVFILTSSRIFLDV
jgi:hypothetical protein